METADDVIDGFWGTDMVENRKFSHIVAKGYDTQVSKLFKFLKLGCLRKKGHANNTARQKKASRACRAGDLADSVFPLCFRLKTEY